MNTAEFESKLSRLACLCVKVGLNLQPGQELIITAPLESSILVRCITKTAYRNGAKLVTCFYDDPGMIHDRFVYADNETLDYFPEWMYRRLAEMDETGAARLWISGPYPRLLSGIEPGKILRVHNAMAKASKLETDLICTSHTNWSLVPFVTTSWACQVFPTLPPKEATSALWEHVFDYTRVNSPHPLLAWQEHDRTLDLRRQFLQSRNFVSLHFYDGQTDLMVGLAEGHQWIGGTTVSQKGIKFCRNIPMEEIFTSPHRHRVDGKVFLSRPLALAGAIVRDLQVEFCDGLVVSVQAKEGREVFETLLSGDEGAGRVGEIGLVPHSSPIARSDLLFYNALLDENSASHLALGQSPPGCLNLHAGNGAANQSSIHIDCMFGNAQMNVDGLSAAGHAEPVMREGEFLFP